MCKKIPDNMRLATINDFKDIRGGRILGKKFFALNSKDESEEYTLTENTDTKILMEFLELKRIYVEK